MTAANPATLSSNRRPNSKLSPAGGSAVRSPVAVQRPFSLRGFASLLMMLCVVIVLASGIALYLAPRGRVANWISWSALSLSRQQWVAVHINASVLFIVVTVTHLAMNWSRLVGYVKKPGRRRIHMKRELVLALAVLCAVFAGTILELPPINAPVEWKYEIRDSWEHRADPTASRDGLGVPERLAAKRSAPSYHTAPLRS